MNKWSFVISCLLQIIVSSCAPIIEDNINPAEREKDLLTRYIHYMIEAYPDDCAVPKKFYEWNTDSDDGFCGGLSCQIPEEWCALKVPVSDAKFDCLKLPRACLNLLDNAVLPKSNSLKSYTLKLESKDQYDSTEEGDNNFIETTKNKRWKEEFMGQDDPHIVENVTEETEPTVGNVYTINMSIPDATENNEASDSQTKTNLSVEVANNKIDEAALDYSFVFDEEHSGMSSGGAVVEDNKAMIDDQPCSDLNQNCTDWAASGHCVTNPFWMLPNCQKSCNSCGTTVADVNKRIAKDGCRNEEELCEFWSSVGECDKNPVWMKLYCRLSCNACQNDQKS